MSALNLTNTAQLSREVVKKLLHETGLDIYLNDQQCMIHNQTSQYILGNWKSGE